MDGFSQLIRRLDIPMGTKRGTTPGIRRWPDGRSGCVLVLALVLLLFLPGGLWAGDSAHELVVMLEAAPKTLDPVYATDAYGVRIAQQLIFEPLVQLGDDLTIVPALAERWQRIAPTRYRFYLARKARFHDGSPVEAADVVYTLESLMAPETASPYGPALRDKIAAVRVVDAHTVDFELRAPFAAFLSELTIPIRSRRAGEDRPLLGSGPFRFARRSPNEIVLERNPDYHRGPAGVERIVFKVVKDENTRVLKLRKGSIDLAINALPLDKVAQFRQGLLGERFTVLEAPGLSYQYLGFNLQDPILSNPLVRRAIAHAIDVDTLITHRQKGHSRRAAGLLPPGSPYELSDAEFPPHDPALAASLLDEAGYGAINGSRFKISYKTSTDRSAVIQARVIQNDLRKVGIEMIVRSYEWGTFYEDIQKGNFQLFSLRWVGVSDPDFYYELFHSSRHPPHGRNRVRYANPQVDRLLEAGRTALDEGQRRRIYHEVQRILARDLPYISLWHNNNIAVVSKALTGFRLHPTGGFHYLPQVRKTGP